MDSYSIERIAHLAGPDSLLISQKRLNGYLAALKKYNLPAIPELIIPYDLSITKVKIYVKYLLELEEPPDALFTVNDPAALEAIQIIKKKGLRIPEDISVVGFSNDYASSLIVPNFSTVAQPVLEMGRTAVELLLEQMDKDMSEWKAITRVLNTTLIIRDSSRQTVGTTKLNL